MRRMYSNPNAKFRGINTGRVRSFSQLGGLPTAQERAEMDAHKKQREQEAEQDEQRELIAMRHAIYAAKKLVKSKDKRRRRRLSKVGFKGARELKLTRTAKVKRKPKEE